MPPTEKLAKPIFPTPAGRVKSGLIRRFGEETAMGTYLKYARHRSFSPKPLSERSQNPKTWGNWEGIGDFCLQKCQRGRQLSPLSEATRLDRSSLTLASKDYKKKGALPLSAIGFANSPIPRNLIQYARTNNSRFGNWRFGYPLFPNNFAAYKKRFTFFRPRTEFRLYIASAEYRSLGYRIFSVSLSERIRRPTPSNSPHSAGGV